MQNKKDSENEVHLIKSGNSSAFRVSKNDRRALDADENTIFKKIVSTNGEEITFRKVEPVNPIVKAAAKRFVKENAAMMAALRDL